MIEKLAYTIASSIKKANPDNTASLEVMKFSLIAIIGTGSSILLSICLAAFFGKTYETILVLFAFVLLRSFSGGYHFKSAEMCSLVSIIGAVTIPLIEYSTDINFYLMCITLLIITLFAPKGKNQSRIFSPQHYPLLKIISIVIILSNFYFQSHVLTSTFLIQAISLIPLLKGGDINEKISQ